jgi:hypothetical protein
MRHLELEPLEHASAWIEANTPGTTAWIDMAEAGRVQSLAMPAAASAGMINTRHAEAKPSPLLARKAAVHVPMV